MSIKKPYKIAIVAFDGMVAADLTTPYELFEHVELDSGLKAYESYVCARDPVVKTQGFDLHVKWGLDQLDDAYTLIVPGLVDPNANIPDELCVAIRQAYLSGTRIVSICTGAFVLAASGILDGQEVTTHWKAASLFSSLYPHIALFPNVLYTDNGQICTSAGAAAGIDLCLHLIRKDFGVAVAANSARTAVVPLERSGGQAQYIVQPISTLSIGLSPILQWIEEHLDQEITLNKMANIASISLRTLNRRFQEQLHMSPLQWVIQARLKRAQCLLESTDQSIEAIAGNVGFGSSASLREHFVKNFGNSPSGYRYVFRKKESSAF
jgi:transcriptional regulator GlxA family with amidase domain